MADIILLGWPQKTGFLENILQKTGFLNRLIGSKVDDILENTEKTLFMCNFEIPLVNHERLFLIVPPNAELEEGFAIWVNKIAKLSIELSIPISLNCAEETYQAILKFVKANKITLTLNYSNFNDWDDYLILSRRIVATDFIILVSARRGYISHLGQLDGIPARLEKHFPDLSKMVIYPQ